jgi:hypothetical protein
VVSVQLQAPTALPSVNRPRYAMNSGLCVLQGSPERTAEEENNFLPPEIETRTIQLHL